MFITDVMVDDDGNVSIYGQGSGVLLTYSPNGEFLEKTKLPYAPEQFISYQRLN